MNNTTLAPTDSDRAVARRVLRRMVYASPRATVTTYMPLECTEARYGCGYGTMTGARPWWTWTIMTAAVEGATLGRLYAAALRGAS